MFRRTHAAWFRVVAQGNVPIQRTSASPVSKRSGDADDAGLPCGGGGGLPAGATTTPSMRVRVAARVCCDRALKALGLAAEDLGPTHATFGRFFSNTILAHGFMFVTMSIGTTQFLQGFIASGNAVTLWLAKDIVPTLLSVAVVNQLVPERNAKQWFVVGYALTNVVTLFDFAAPSIIAAGYQPYAGVLSTMAKSMTHLLLTTCRATILEQLAHGNNFGTLMRAYTNAGTIAFAVCYGCGLMMAHCLSWHAQFVVMATSAAASMFFSTRAVREFVPRKLTWAVARQCAWACVRSGGFVGEQSMMPSAYVPLSPEQYFGDAGCMHTMSTRRLAPIETNCNLALLTSSSEHLEATFRHEPSLKLLAARGKDLLHVPPAQRDSTFIVFESDAMVADILGALLLIEYAASIGVPISEVVTDGDGRGGSGDAAAGSRWLTRGRELEAKLHAAGWLMTASGALDDATMRVTLSHKSSPTTQ